MARKPFCVGVFVVAWLFTTFAWCDCALAQEQADSKHGVNPLVRLLQVKGILTEEEVAQINQVSPPADADQQLARLLLLKGVITQADYNHTFGAATVMSASTPATSAASVIPAVYRMPVLETFAVPGPTGGLPLYRGIPSRTWRDLRSEGGTIFTF